MIIGDHHTISTDIQNILIIQLGDIGDVVWAIPTLWAVKDAYPQANVSVLLREGFGCLLESDPSIYKTFEVKRDHEGHLHNTIDQVRLIKELRQEHFDLAFDLRSGDRGAILARLTGAPMRASLYYHDVPFWRNRLFTHLLVEPAPPKERVYGAAEQSLSIVRGFGIQAKKLIPRIWVSDRVMERVNRILAECNIDSVSSDASHRWLTINPFSRWSYKEWPYDKWVQVIDWLWNKFKLTSVIVGSPDEMAKAAALVNMCSGYACNLAGKTALDELAGVLSLGSFHIGVDSAAPHIAAAVGTPTIIIYGPSDWRDWAPVGNQHRVVVPDRECVPCYKKGCNGSGLSQCLETLEVETVQKAIQEQIREQAVSHR